MMKNKPPAYVSIILNGNIRINGDISDIETKVANLKKDPLGYLAVSFEEGSKPYFENVDLVDILFDLNDKGIVFGEDFKQLYSPAEFMRELQAKGVLKKDFKSIYWTGIGEWQLKENFVEQHL